MRHIKGRFSPLPGIPLKPVLCSRMKSFWDERYGQSEYIYGEEPNVYFREKLATLTPGRLLLPAEGEGRNAVFAASQGWEVYAFDQSGEGKKKAEALAQKKRVQIRYDITDCAHMHYPADFFDAIALIYAHFPSTHRKTWHQQLIAYLKPGGTLILEAFSKSHQDNQRLNPNAGGPKDVDLLYLEEDIRTDFEPMEVSECMETETALHEGQYHFGHAAVIRYVGRKKS